MGATSSDIKGGYRICPHCNGKTTCKCGSCAVPHPEGFSIVVEGICKVCKGLGQVPK